MRWAPIVRIQTYQSSMYMADHETYRPPVTVFHLGLAHVRCCRVPFPFDQPNLSSMEVCWLLAADGFTCFFFPNRYYGTIQIEERPGCSSPSPRSVRAAFCLLNLRDSGLLCRQVVGIARSGLIRPRYVLITRTLDELYALPL